MAMSLISTTTVGSGGSASISFSNIPQTGKHLVLLCSLRLSDNSLNVNLAVNGSTANSEYLSLAGGTGSVFSEAVSGPQVAFSSINSDTTSCFGSLELNITNYVDPRVKGISADWTTMTNSSSTYLGIHASRRDNTNPITSVAIQTASGTFVQNSTVSLYIVS